MTKQVSSCQGNGTREILGSVMLCEEGVGHSVCAAAVVELLLLELLFVELLRSHLRCACKKLFAAFA